MCHLKEIDLSNTSSQTLVLGDFTLDKSHMTLSYKNLETYFAQNSFQQVVPDMLPTSIYGTMLDLVFSNASHLINIARFATYYSDHCIIFITVDI